MVVKTRPSVYVRVTVTPSMPYSPSSVHAVVIDVEPDVVAQLDQLDEAVVQRQILGDDRVKRGGDGVGQAVEGLREGGVRVNGGVGPTVQSVCE